MTDKERLQQLFQAALQDDFTCERPPTRAFPKSAAAVLPVAEMKAAPVAAAEPLQPSLAEMPVTKPVVPLVESVPNAGLDEATSAELGVLLDAQLKRVAGKRRRDTVVTLLVLLGLTGGGFGWFVHSPNRVEAFHTAIAEIRSIGDIKGLLAKYQVAFDKIGARSDQINESALALGVDPASVSADEDPYMEAETEQFTGEKGAGTADRNQKLQEKFGNFAKAPVSASGGKATATKGSAIQ